jgi:GWxTD domain-containing protein
MRLTKYILISIFIYASSLIAQVEMANQGNNKGPRFYADIATTIVPDDPNLTRLNVFVEVQNDELQFIKTGDGYEATYEIAVVILDKENDQVDGKIWKEEIFVEQYDATNNRKKYNLSYDHFDLDPGNYKINLMVQDLETEIESKRELKIRVEDYSKDKLQLSEITFLKNFERDSVYIKAIYPSVTNQNKGLKGKSYAYFELYNPKLVNTAEISYEMKGRNTKFKIKNNYSIPLTGKLTREVITIYVDSLEHDAYDLKIKAKAGKDEFEIEKQFNIRWDGLPMGASDLETAIEQVKYIATREEWKRLDKAKPEDKMKEFKAFWKRHDPTPGTESNEALEAHYGRIDYANQYFSVMKRKGWRTDMGMVFIILGSPDDIERNAYPRYSKPYEIWRYYRYNRELLFYDHTGFGEYRLATPFSIYEFHRYLQK